MVYMKGSWLMSFVNGLSNNNLVVTVYMFCSKYLDNGIYVIN